MKSTCFTRLSFVLALICLPFLLFSQKGKKEVINDTLKSDLIGGLSFRGIGPAFASGRIADFAVNPKNHSEYYVAVASGHIWKTENNGTTWNPVFDNYGAYAIGCLAMDPCNSKVVWAGTGENNHQRALGYGDGVYKTVDGGKSWKNMGLKNSRQIGKIVIDPRNTNIVFVAAEGSVWGPGGDRGLYKTEDGGETWKCVLTISENTGVNDIVMDPRDPDVMYCSSEQRRRHVFTKIGGGPETAVYKSTDGGNTWRKLTSGLPGGDKGGIGLAISPVNPDVIYAIIEAAGNDGGFFRSVDRGESWEKMNSYTAQGQYYNEIYCDPVDVDIVYSVETVSKFTEDGGRNWKSIGNNSRHVDDHAMWIDPDDTKHFMIGGDGGVYESFDRGKNYLFKENLPVTQFYRVAVDDTEPFYWVYGGTQDNNSMGGPSRNIRSNGVTSDEWVVTLGGDGFWQAIEPGNPDVVYSAYQYGNIYRYDKKSGESVYIRPEPRKGEETYKWNWDSPFILSPHSKTRLYMAANKVFRSDDRGNTWKVISDDLTAKIDRNSFPVMGRYWGVDAVAKDVSTSQFGTIVSLAESKIKENLVYAGTDDGLIQVTENAGETWTKVSSFPGIPENTYVSDVFPSRFDENIVYASFNNHQRDDFKPYILKSTDKGKTWTSISANLPENGVVHTIEQDFKNPELLFAGTEFGIYCSVNGGRIWTKLGAGIPTISVRDIAIQERENDLVLATFGRGFYILDNYSPLRDLNKEVLDKEAHIFQIKDALMYIQDGGRYGQGSTYFSAANPPYGATITYYLKESPKTLKAQRLEKEKDLVKEKNPIPIPTVEELRAEEKEIKPYLIFTITDEQGNEVRRLTTAASKGVNRITWDLRYSGTYPIGLKNNKYDPLSGDDGGILALPGKYFVSVSKVVNGVITALAGPEPFTAKVLDNTTLPAEDRSELVAFHKKLAELARVMAGTERFARNLMERVQYDKQAASNTPGANQELFKDIESIESRIDQVLWKFNGQPAKASDEEIPPAQVPLNQRLNYVIYAQYSSTSAPTQTMKSIYSILEEEFPPVLEELKTIFEKDIPSVESKLDNIAAPWTPGRVPVWNRQ